MVELIPNCSEIVCRIDLSQLALLKKNGYSIIGKKDLKDSWNSDLHLMTPSGEKIRFVEKDDLANSDVIICGDYDREFYPILKEVSELIGEEIMGHDGGGTYSYEEWLETYEKESRLSELELLIHKNKELIKEQKKIKRELNE